MTARDIMRSKIGTIITVKTTLSERDYRLSVRGERLMLLRMPLLDAELPIRDYRWCEYKVKEGSR